jgi:hypothetical protein
MPSTRKFPIPSYLFEVGLVILLALATVAINWKMIRDGLNGMIDLRWHTTWLQHFFKQISEGIWYPRWLAGTNYGYGSPTFVFYPPLVYYLGTLLKFSGLNTENAIIALFSLALFCSGLTFYIYGRKRWGAIAAFVGALAYMTAPYLANDIYWRGGVTSLFVQAWIPLGLWLTDRAISQPRWRIKLAIFWAIMALTHTPSLLLCMIFWLPYTLFFVIKTSWKAVAATLVCAGTGLGIASFYLLPALLEQSFVSIETMKEVSGGFKANLFGSGLPFFPLHSIDRITYIFLHQLLAIIILTSVALVTFRKQAAIIQEIWRWLAFALALAFIMSNLSELIWQASPTLQMFQFPWRLLQLFSFTGAALCGAVGSVTLKLDQRHRLLLVLIILATIGFNFRYSYQLSRSLPALHNPRQGNVVELETLTAILSDPYTDKLIDVEEYRPLLKTGNPAVPVIGQPRVSVLSGKAEIQINQWESYNRMFTVKAEEASTVRIRTYYYPAWHLHVNQKPHPISMSSDGTMELKLEPGFYTVELHYQWTQAFMLGGVLSLLSLVALSLFWIGTYAKFSTRPL